MYPFTNVQVCCLSWCERVQVHKHCLSSSEVYQHSIALVSGQASQGVASQGVALH